MKKHNIIYETTNKVNGKSYIGQHSTDNLDDGYLGSGVALKNAVKKHGKKNFIRRILEFCLPCQAHIDHKERQWIEILGTREDGYNIAIGGDNVLHSQETINKMKAKINKGFIDGRKVWNKGKKGVYSEGQLKNLSEKCLEEKCH